jgi:hypothetical protein
MAELHERRKSCTSTDIGVDSTTDSFAFRVSTFELWRAAASVVVSARGTRLSSFFKLHGMLLCSSFPKMVSVEEAEAAVKAQGASPAPA